MIDLIDALDSATSLLDTALDQYLDACAAIQTYCAQAPTVTGVPHTLSSRIVNELTAAFSHESKIKQARSVISQIKNGSTTVTPVYALPSEILSRIFLLVMDSTPCVEADNSKSRHMPRYPDFLSHVCSRWRRVAIGLPELWTHIDLVYHHTSHQKYVERAMVFASRAGRIPLDVHIRAPSSLDYLDGAFVIEEKSPLFVGQTDSLELTTPNAIGEFEPKVYEHLFKTLEPAILRQITLTDTNGDEPGCICASSEEDPGTLPEYGCRILQLPHGAFENILHPVQVLRLSGLSMSCRAPPRAAQGTTMLCFHDSGSPYFPI